MVDFEFRSAVRVLLCILGSSKLGGVERLERINISDRLRFLVPPEILQRYAFGREIRYEKAVLFYGDDGFFHIEMLWWLWAYSAEFRGPAAGARA